MGKATKGNRTASGKLKNPSTAAARLAKAWDYGNDRVQERRTLFDCMAIKGGKAVDQVYDGIGQLWALDFLEGHGFDGAALRDAGRLYGELYWHRYSATAPKTGKLEPASRTSGGDFAVTKRDLLFDRMDENLRGCTYERRVLGDLVIDPWYSDDIAWWANRLVTTELVARNRIPRAVEFSSPSDHGFLAAAIRGLLALVDGALPARFERRAA